ncbi:hypothetical protein AVEN_272832-1, partial [Araneus ventricosus]
KSNAQIPETWDIRRKGLKYGANEKKCYDKHHGDKDLQELEPVQAVWITDVASSRHLAISRIVIACRSDPPSL